MTLYIDLSKNCHHAYVCTKLNFQMGQLVASLFDQPVYTVLLFVFLSTCTGMVKIVVDQHQDVVMLRSSTLDCYLTGHSDTGVVDGRVSTRPHSQ